MHSPKRLLELVFYKDFGSHKKQHLTFSDEQRKATPKLPTKPFMTNNALQKIDFFIYLFLILACTTS